ncbi:hypothetical protein RZS08_04520, partial [Arthrospira platensis SPKY1]|nr:hypothetical protein [Arthrospira platensis SPKY1]
GDGSLAESIVFNGNTLSSDVSYISDINPPLAPILYFTKFKEVTEIVQLSGNGNYTLSNLNLNPIIELYCSNAIYFSNWSMLVIYEESTLPNTQLNIYNGFR